MQAADVEVAAALCLEAEEDVQEPKAQRSSASVTGNLLHAVAKASFQLLRESLHPLALLSLDAIRGCSPCPRACAYERYELHAGVLRSCRRRCSPPLPVRG